MESVGMFEVLDRQAHELASEEDLLRIHAPEYIAAVRAGSDDHHWGLSAGDTPAFPGMWTASRAYTGATIAAARAVRDGEPVAINITGGLHHAHRAKASGFCVFNDPAIAVSILREEFNRVAYVDLDLHHGDGVQWLYYDDPTVLTLSVHEDGRYLFPGTGFVSEMGANGTSVNIPVPPHTADDLWYAALEPVLKRAFGLFRPQAVVLQMGADPHSRDPLGHLDLSVQGWLRGVELVKSFGLPTVAVGGGGYDLSTVPRMWTLAAAALTGRRLQDEIPEPLASEYGVLALKDAAWSESPAGLEQEVGRTLAELESGPLRLLAN